MICFDNPQLRFNDCKVGDELRFGRYNGEYIDWVVISASKEKILLVSKNIIDADIYPGESWIGDFVSSSFTGNERKIVEKAYILNDDDAFI